MVEKKETNEKYEFKVQNFKKFTQVTVVLIIVSTFGLTLAAGTFDIVPSGTVRIAVDPSGETIGPIDSGWHFGWCNPFATKYDFSITVQTLTIRSLHADCLDGHVTVDLTVTYILHRENVTKVFDTYGSAFGQSLIEPVVTSAFRDSFSGNTMREVALENRTQIQVQCQEAIFEGLAEYYVEFISLRVQNILLPASFSEAQIQTQIALEQLRAANITHQITVLEALTAAEVEQIYAESLANATVIQAQSMAEAIQLVVQELNVTGNITESHVLTYLYIQALSDYAQYGDVLMITDGSVPIIVDVPNTTNSTSGG